MDIDDGTDLVQFDRHETSIRDSLCLLPLLSQRISFLTLGGVDLDLFLEHADMDEFAGHVLMLSFLSFEMHIDDVVVFIQHHNDLIPDLNGFCP